MDKDKTTKEALGLALWYEVQRTDCDIVRALSLIEQGAAPSMPGRTPVLWWAAVRGYTEIVKALLDKGVDVNSCSDGHKISALMTAAFYGHENIVEILLTAKADVNWQSDMGITALMNAVSGNDPQLCAMLLKAGTDVNLRDVDGETALMWAARLKNRKECAAMLLAHGAWTNIKDGEGQTAQMLAEARGHDDVVTLIQEKNYNNLERAFREGLPYDMVVRRLKPRLPRF